MNTLCRTVLVVLGAFLLAACGKSPLDKDLEAYARVNQEIHEQAERGKLHMERYKADPRGASKRLETFLMLLANSKTQLDQLQLQDVQMQEAVGMLRTGYENWGKFGWQLHDARGRRDEQRVREISPNIAQAEAQVAKAQNAIIALAKNRGVTIAAPFTLCADYELNCE